MIYIYLNRIYSYQIAIIFAQCVSHYKTSIIENKEINHFVCSQFLQLGGMFLEHKILKIRIQIQKKEREKMCETDSMPFFPF